MNLKEKIGQLLMFGWQGETAEENLKVSAHARALVEEFKVGGIILLGRNVQNPEQVANTLNELQSLSKLPLFIAADQEGGLVTRLKDPFTIFPGNMALGATRSPDYCYKAANTIAEELLAVGVNFNFAPCVDVNINPDNPIIGVRSYGESPELVAELGVAAIKGYQSAGILACAKHFPGHGDTSVDTHLSLPVIPYDRDRLNAVELKPFAEAIKAGVASIMTSHIAFAALDGKLPATLSKSILTNLLREEMGFDGLVVTDCLEMKAIADNFGTAEAAILALNAGVDILLACHTLEVQAEIRDALIRAVESGEVPEQRVDEAVERILAAKEKFDIESKRFVKVEKLRTVIGADDHRNLELEIAHKAVTVLRNKDKILPLKLGENDQILVLGMHPATESFAQAIRKYHKNTKHLRVSASPSPEEISRINQLMKQSKVALLTTCPSEPWTRGFIKEKIQAEFVSRMLNSKTPAVIVTVREPYDLRHFPDSRTCIATYGYPAATVQATADLIFGKVRPSGRLPVSVPGYADFGAGISF
ncbi:MAG: beta-N-acetylhexosaminidase [Armatimonadetes bacterium]|nr:beta-N-acetylhexosaminidase [Armatimonadota bacterium]